MYKKTLWTFIANRTEKRRRGKTKRKVLLCQQPEFVYLKTFLVLLRSFMRDWELFEFGALWKSIICVSEWCAFTIAAKYAIDSNKYYTGSNWAFYWLLESRSRECSSIQRHKEKYWFPSETQWAEGRASCERSWRLPHPARCLFLRSRLRRQSRRSRTIRRRSSWAPPVSCSRLRKTNFAVDRCGKCQMMHVFWMISLLKCSSIVYSC